ncbi:MAG: hemerythrin domain-containing protein [Ignavibacteria bacterium]|nr:hemerythrin domain-containing protein [Ignavibacteriota bacterium]
MSNPIKRDPSIQPLSRDHHHGLLLCWKIRTGFSKGVSAERMKLYTDWFYENHIMKHFEIEEKYVFPVLGNDNELVKQALNDHKLIEKLFTEKNNSNFENSLKQLSDELEKHIRFEERVLFNEIQLAATVEQLDIIKKNHPDEKFCENQTDTFWK